MKRLLAGDKQNRRKKKSWSFLVVASSHPADEWWNISRHSVFLYETQSMSGVTVSSTSVLLVNWSTKSDKIMLALMLYVRWEPLTYLNQINHFHFFIRIHLQVSFSRLRRLFKDWAGSRKEKGVVINKPSLHVYLRNSLYCRSTKMYKKNSLKWLSCVKFRSFLSRPIWRWHLEAYH